MNSTRWFIGTWTQRKKVRNKEITSCDEFLCGIKLDIRQQWNVGKASICDDQSLAYQIAYEWREWIIMGHTTREGGQPFSWWRDVVVAIWEALQGFCIFHQTELQQNLHLSAIECHQWREWASEVQLRKHLYHLSVSWADPTFHFYNWIPTWNDKIWCEQWDPSLMPLLWSWIRISFLLTERGRPLVILHIVCVFGRWGGRALIPP